MLFFRTHFTKILKFVLFIILQDLPEFFEDNMKRWMEPFHMLIVTEFKVLVTTVCEWFKLLKSLIECGGTNL